MLYHQQNKNKNYFPINKVGFNQYMKLCQWYLYKNLFRSSVSSRINEKFFSSFVFKRTHDFGIVMKFVYWNDTRDISKGLFRRRPEFPVVVNSYIDHFQYLKSTPISKKTVSYVYLKVNGYVFISLGKRRIPLGFSIVAFMRRFFFQKLDYEDEIVWVPLNHPLMSFLLKHSCW